jgi:hypothetical protein
MVRLMAEAGSKVIFLGLESVSAKNLTLSGKGNIVDASRRAVDLCHAHGIIVIGGLIFGFPDDDETDIIENYRFLQALEADIPYCQILTPYPATVMRRQLLDQGLVTNPHDYTRYNGLWANVKNRHLEAEQLQYLVWLAASSADHRLVGSVPPPAAAGRLWIPFWTHGGAAGAEMDFDRRLAKTGMDRAVPPRHGRQAGMNAFQDLEKASLQSFRPRHCGGEPNEIFPGRSDKTQRFLLPRLRPDYSFPVSACRRVAGRPAGPENHERRQAGRISFQTPSRDLPFERGRTNVVLSSANPVSVQGPVLYR